MASSVSASYGGTANEVTVFACFNWSPPGAGSLLIPGDRDAARGHRRNPAVPAMRSRRRCAPPTGQGTSPGDNGRGHGGCCSGIGALVVDIGFGVMLRRQEQNAVDPAAIAAARFIDNFSGQTHRYGRG